MTFPPLRPTENQKGIDKSQKLRLGFFPNFCYSYRVFLIRNETDHVAIFKKNCLSDKVYINWIYYSLSEGTLVKKQKGWRSKGTYRKLHCWYARPSLLILIFDLFFVFILINRSDWIWSRQCTDIMICLFVCFLLNCFSGEISKSLDSEMFQRFHILLWEKAAVCYEVSEW